MEIEMDSENERRLKSIGKPPLLLNQEESLAEKVKKYPCLFGKHQKTYKERDAFQKFALNKTFVRHPFQLNKFCMTIIATITCVNISRFLDEM